MVEPFSLAVNVIQIVSACTSTIKTIHDICQRYTDASAKLRSLGAKASLVKATLNELEKALKGRSSFFAKKIDSDPDLKAAIDQTLTGCWTVFLLLQKELRKWLPDADQDAKVIQKAGLLWNDDIIQDYRIQIEGHVEGLKTVLVCLQAQTVAETHETLQQANATLTRIAHATLNIRETHKEMSFPESVYEGYTTFDEDKEFDTELLNTPAYRAAFKMARHNSILGGDTLIAGGSLLSGKSNTRNQPNIDILSDQPVEERSNSLVKVTELLGTDAVGDLINLHDDGAGWSSHPSPSPNVQLMFDLLATDNTEITRMSKMIPEDAIPKDPPKSHANGHAHPDSLVPARTIDTRSSSDGYLDSLLDELLHHSAAVESMSAVQAHEPRRDSGQPLNEEHQRPKISERPPVPIAIYPSGMRASTTSSEEKIPVRDPTTEKIPSWSEHPQMQNSITSAMKRTLSNSTSSTIPTLYSPVLHMPDLSPISPSSPTSDHASYFMQQYSGKATDVPHADEFLEQHLRETMSARISSADHNERLDWAEEVLRCLALKHAHEERQANLNAPKGAPPKIVSGVGDDLRSEARRIVNDRRRAEDGRAYFLFARYLANDKDKEQWFHLASLRGHHRSLYYLGVLSEEQGHVGDAVSRYKAGEAHKDAACLHRLAIACQDGKLDLKKDKAESLRLLKLAADYADHDYAQPLHDLALLYLAPAPSKLKSMGSKPLVSRNVPEAMSLLRKAALMGHGPSQLRVGKLYRTGYLDGPYAKQSPKDSGKLTRSGTVFNRRSSSVSDSSHGDAEVDPNLAMHYLHLASRRNLPEAEFEIAHDLLFSRGELTKQQQKVAFEYTRRALHGGVPLAYGLMGKVLEEGIGCKVDLVKAEAMYWQGGLAGDKWSRQRSDALRNKGIGITGEVYGYVKPHKGVSSTQTYLDAFS